MKKPKKGPKHGSTPTIRKKSDQRRAESAARAERARALLASLDDSADGGPGPRAGVDRRPQIKPDAPASAVSPVRKPQRPAAKRSQPLGRNAVADPAKGDKARDAELRSDGAAGDQRISADRPASVGRVEATATVAEVNGVVVPSDNHPPLAEKHRPKRHAPGSLKFMDVVFYRNPTGSERMFIESAPKDWTKTAWVRITDKPLREDRDSWPNERQSFCVHADMLDLSPIQPKGQITLARNLPTEASVARAERAKAGIRDVGDPIATALRACKSLDDVYRRAAKYLGVPDADLRAKYGKLNPGQQRMNLGNRMRNKWKKTGEEV